MNPDTLLSILIPSITTFVIGIAITPIITNFLYEKKLWKKKNVFKTIDGKEATLTAKIHNDEGAPVPRLGGLVIWVGALLSAAIFYFISNVFGQDGNLLDRLDLISRNQTWLPLAALLFGGILGAIDDLLVVDYFSKGGTYVGGGLSLRIRLLCVGLIGAFVAYWFVFKLGFDAVTIPFYGELIIGPYWYAALVIITMLAIFSGGIIDGVDGLSGGVMTAIFSSYGIIAMTHGQYDLAKLCFVIVSAILAFLWFNIPPARFYMSETGMIALSLCLSVVVFLVDGVAVLPVVGFLLMATVMSVLIQLFYKKFFKRKLFLIAPIHHHFEAKGWPNYKVTMRYWIIAFMCSMAGIILSLF